MSSVEEPRRAAIYARISNDRAGAGLGVERQIEDCRALAARRGLNVLRVFDDNDISAYTGRRRPGYEDLLTLMRTYAIDVVVVWHTDRLHRRPVELEEYIQASTTGRQPIDTYTVQAGDLDLSTSSGRMIARMLGAAARHESEIKSDRIRRQRAQAARAGKANGSLGYGYHADQSINSEQAAILRECADRLMTGETLYAVVTDLNKRGVPSPRNRDEGWRSANLRSTITRTTIAGWREWRPGEGSKKGGKGLGGWLAQGDWTPILDRAVVEQLRVLLFDERRPVLRRPPENLLTGVLICGICKHGLNGSGDGRTDRRRYRCISQPGAPNCGRVGIVAEPVEEILTAAVLDVLSGSRISAARQRVNPLELPAIERALFDARAAHETMLGERARGELTSTEWASMRPIVLDRIARAEQARAVTTAGLASISHVPTGAAVHRWWADATVDQRRVALRAVLLSVEIKPTLKPGFPKFDPDRVGEAVWRV